MGRKVNKWKQKRWLRINQHRPKSFLLQGESSNFLWLKTALCKFYTQMVFLLEERKQKWCNLSYHITARPDITALLTSVYTIMHCQSTATTEYLMANATLIWHHISLIAFSQLPPKDILCFINSHELLQIVFTGATSEMASWWRGSGETLRRINVHTLRGQRSRKQSIAQWTNPIHHGVGWGWRWGYVAHWGRWFYGEV